MMIQRKLGIGGVEMKNILIVLITAGVMLGLSTGGSVHASVKRTGQRASIRARTHESRSVTRPFNDGLIVDLKGKPALNSASGSTRSRMVNPPVRGFKTMSGMDSETEVIARPRPGIRQ